MNIGDLRVTHEPPDAERHVRVVWEEGSRKAPSYPIRLCLNLPLRCYEGIDVRLRSNGRL